MDWYIWLILGFGIGVVITFVICEYMAVQQSRAFDEVARKYVSTISRQRDDLLAIVRRLTCTLLNSVADQLETISSGGSTGTLTEV